MEQKLHAQQQEAEIISLARKQQLSFWFLLYTAGLVVWCGIHSLSLPEGFVLPTGSLQTFVFYSLIFQSIVLLHLNKSFLLVNFDTRAWWILAGVWVTVYFILDTNLLRMPAVIGSGSPWAFQRQTLNLLVLLTGWWPFMVGTGVVAAQVYARISHPFHQPRYLIWAIFLILSILGSSMLFFMAVHPRFEPEGLTLNLLGSVLAASVVIPLLTSRGSDSSYRIFRDFSTGISTILDPNKLTAAAAVQMKEAIRANRCMLFLVSPPGVDEDPSLYRLEGVTSSPGSTGGSAQFSTSSPISQFLCRERRPVTRYELYHLPGIQKSGPDELDWLDGLQGELFVPFFIKDEWTGLFVFSSKLSGIPYTDEDLDLLSMLAQQTAVALQNARLVENLTRVNHDLRRAYSALEHANSHVERLDRTKSDFISVASHELRTPLSVIRGYSEMLRDETSIKNNSFNLKLVSGIHSGILRLHEVVDSMLDMASIDTSTLELHMEQVSLHRLVRMVCEGFKNIIQDRSLVVKIEDLRSLPNIEADPEALRKVFSNLVANAIKYTPDGGSINISGRPLPGSTVHMPEGAVEVVITDTGIGVEKELHELIFAKFYQTADLELHSTGKSKFKGAGPGLGLSITKGIVEAHGGKIYVESPGRDEEKYPGSSFHVILPIKNIRNSALGVSP